MPILFLGKTKAHVRTRSRSSQKKKSLGANLGFTLLELMVVITIIAALASMVLPNMKFPSKQGQSTLLSIQKPIEKWRLKALQTGQGYIMRFDGRKNEIKIVSLQEKDLLASQEEENLLDHQKVEDTFYISALNEKNVRSIDIEIRSTGSTIPFEIFTTEESDRLVYSGLMVPGRIENATGEAS